MLAPADARLQFGDACLRPAIPPDSERFYLLTMLSQDVFFIDDVRVKVRFSPTYRPDETVAFYRIGTVLLTTARQHITLTRVEYS